jgi:2-C-methyl-D-erythritol 4-phosphate cytidylyltransferase
MNAALILAGGSGERMQGLSVPKQYCLVEGRPVFAYGLRRFQQCPEISCVVMVAEESWRGLIRDWIEGEAAAKFLGFADPGVTRQQSVYAGLLTLKGVLSEGDLVVIHDAARPLVTEGIIRRCVEASSGCDGATPVLRMADTVYQSKDGHTISALLNREEIYAGQTPEAYRFGKYLAAHKRLTAAELTQIRGSSEIAFKCGMDIRLFPGDERNFKITVVPDLERFRMQVEGWGCRQ